MKGKIIISPNPYRDRGLAVTARIKALLEAAGFKTVVSPVFVETPENSSMLPLSRALAGASLLVSVGGDGTFLAVARQAVDMDIPLLGVNMGTKGFMAGLEPEDVELVVRAAAGEYRPSSRMLLSVELVRGDGESLTDVALNDAVVKSDVNCIGIEVAADEVDITTYSGDGVIASTPTGSTAYSMSAGGPIVEPEADNLIVTPICAHELSARSFVLSPERTVTLRPDRLRGRRAVLSVDGGEPVELCPGDEVRVRRSERRIVIADMGVRSFYETTFNKLRHNEERFL